MQNTEEITDPQEKRSQVVAGPYHPAFRQLVEGRLWYDAIDVYKRQELTNTNKSRA